MTKTDISPRSSIDSAALAGAGLAQAMPVVDRQAASRVESLLPIIRSSAESYARRFNHVLPSASGDTLA